MVKREKREKSEKSEKSEKKAEPKQYEGIQVDDEALLARVKAHAEFFDELVNRIPAKYYAPAQKHEDIYMRYKRSQSEKQLAKQATKENSKKAKRAKLDPDNVKSTEEVIMERATAGSDDDDDDDDDDVDDDENEVEDDEEEEAEIAAQAAGKGKKLGKRQRPQNHAAPTGWNMEQAPKADLQERLKAKIELARERRKADERRTAVKSAKEWRTKTVTAGLEEKARKEKAKAKAKAKNGQLEADEPGMKGEANGGGSGAIAVDDVDLDMQASRLVNGAGPQKKDKKGLSLEKKLKKAQAVQEVMQEGGQKADRHVWSSAMKRAAGEKVMDDPRLLKQALKRKEKQSKKSREAWEKRTEETAATTKAKQDKRSSNLKARKDKKMERRIAKREKKMLRPGFEGRKDGFINKKDD